MASNPARGGFTETRRVSRPQSEVNRGTQDELEVLSLVLAELPIQKQLVLDRLRAAKERMSKRGGNTDSADAKRRAE